MFRGWNNGVMALVWGNNGITTFSRNNREQRFYLHASIVRGHSGGILYAKPERAQYSVFSC